MATSTSAPPTTVAYDEEDNPNEKMPLTQALLMAYGVRRPPEPTMGDREAAALNVPRRVVKRYAINEDEIQWVYAHAKVLAPGPSDAAKKSYELMRAAYKATPVGLRMVIFAGLVLVGILCGGIALVCFVRLVQNKLALAKVVMLCAFAMGVSLLYWVIIS